jgi:hypothetical protein
MTTMNLYDMTDTWNAGATTFTAIKMDVTDTASAAGSLLLDLQVGGTSRFSVSKTGVIITGSLGVSASTFLTFGGTTAAFPALKRSGTTLAVRLADDTADAPLTASALVSTASPVNTTSIAALGYSLTGSDASSLFDVSGTWNTTGTPTLLKANVTDTASNAASLLLDLQVGGTSRVAVTKGGHIVQAGSYHEMAEMTAPAAPATNGVRIYAEDNGSGKTRLMARFATGSAVQIAIEP